MTEHVRSGASRRRAAFGEFIARVQGQAFSCFAQARAPLKLRVQQAPASLLMEILEAMAAGRGVTIIPENAGLSTVQAAEVLNVSRPIQIKLFEGPLSRIGRSASSAASAWRM